MGLLIVGTDTEIGKTVVSALVLTRYAELQPRYWKPVASGSLEGRDVEDVEHLTGGCIETVPESYLLPEPLSPHLAARLEGVSIDLNRLTRELRRLSTPPQPLVIEGIGGLMVPLTEQGDLLIDLFSQWDLPCLLVARSTLGTINHSLLSLEALRRRKMTIAGVVLSGPPNEENRRAIETYGQTTIIGELPRLEPLTPTSLKNAARDFDVARCLVPYLSSQASNT